MTAPIPGILLALHFGHDWAVMVVNMLVFYSDNPSLNPDTIDKKNMQSIIKSVKSHIDFSYHSNYTNVFRNSLAYQKDENLWETNIRYGCVGFRPTIF